MAFKKVSTREPSSNYTKVWKFDCCTPVNWGPDVDDQLRGQVVLWNALVEIDRLNRKEYCEILSGDPAVADVQATLALGEAQMAMLIGQRAELRKSTRSKAKTPVEDAAIKALSAEMKTLRTASKEIFRSARATMSGQLKSLAERRIAAIVAARQSAGAAGLWWGNYNATIASFDVARQRAMKDGTILRPKQFDGTGRLTAQIIGGMSPDDLLRGARTEIEIVPAPHGDRYSTLHMTAYARGRKVRRRIEAQMIVDRPFPPGAVIKSVQFNRRRQSPGVLKHSVAFVLSVPVATRPVALRPIAAVDIGWRMLSDDQLRIAVLVDDSGSREDVFVPADVLRRLRLVEEIHADIDADLNAEWCAVKGAEWAEAPTGIQDILASLRHRRPHPRHIKELLNAWPDDGWEPHRRQGLVNWLRESLRERRRMAATRENALRFRKDWMRKLVAGWLRRYSTIIVDGHDLSGLVTVDLCDGAPSPLTTNMRWNSRVAACGELRAWMVDVGKRNGFTVVKHDGESNAPCPHCGAPHKHDPKSVIQVGKCGHQWDQDWGAAINMLLAYTRCERSTAT